MQGAIVKILNEFRDSRNGFNRHRIQRQRREPAWPGRQSRGRQSREGSIRTRHAPKRRPAKVWSHRKSTVTSACGSNNSTTRAIVELESPNPVQSVPVDVHETGTPLHITGTTAPDSRISKAMMEENKWISLPHEMRSTPLWTGASDSPLFLERNALYRNLASLAPKPAHTVTNSGIPEMGKRHIATFRHRSR
jgi:hypothetical protein